MALELTPLVAVRGHLVVLQDAIGSSFKIPVTEVTSSFHFPCEDSLQRNVRWFARFRTLGKSVFITLVLNSPVVHEIVRDGLCD